MKKLHYILSCFLVMLVSTVCLFTGCDNPLDNLKIKLTGDSLVAREQDNVFDLTLTKIESEDDETWSALVNVEVEGLTSDMRKSVVWNYNAKFIQITELNETRTKVKITGGTSTEIPTKIRVFSEETEKAFAEINVTNIIVPKSIDALRFNEGELGIPLGVEYSLDPSELFEFDPIDATVPEYKFDINGVVVNSTEPFVLEGLQDGMATLTATPLNESDFSAENYNALSRVVQNVRLYTPLTNENTKIIYKGETEEVTQIELVKNTSQNQVVLKVDTFTNVECKVTASNNIIYDEVTNQSGKLRVSFSNITKELMFIGLGTLPDWTDINITFSVEGVENSLSLTKTIQVRIVDFPDAIIINDTTGDSEYTMRVFDKYASDVSGAEFVIKLSPESDFYNGVVIQANTDEMADPTLVTKLKINGETFDGQYETISGEKLYLTNDKGFGQVKLWVYAKSTMNTDEVVRRHVVINLEQGVTEINVASDYLDTASGNLILEVDEYAVGSFFTKQIKVDILPETASFDTVSVLSENKQIATVKVVDQSAGEILITGVSAGYTNILFTALSGVKYTLPVRVVVKLTNFTINFAPNVPQAQLGKDLTVLRDIMVGNETAKTLDSAWVAVTGSNSGINLVNSFYPATSISAGMISQINFESDEATVAFAYNTSSNILQNVLSTPSAGEALLVATVEYFALDSTGVNLVLNSMETRFNIKVFEPIKYIEVSDTNIELLATETSGSGTIQSVYDIENNSKNITIDVFPTYSSVQSNRATWTLVGNTSKLGISNKTGYETTVTAKPLSSLDNRVQAELIVSVVDLNGIAYTQTISILVTKIKRITNISIDKYDETIRDSSGLYFELFKEDSFELNLSIAPTDATNKNIEYIVFDAEKLTGMASGKDIIIIDSGRTLNGSKVYEYYRVKPRINNENPEVYATQYLSNTVELVKNDENNRYSVVPKNSGYAFVFLIPQDALRTKIETITTLTDQLRTVSDNSSIKRMLVTVADGKIVPYQLYTAEDVASIGSTRGLDKNYHLMNTIDMSNYLAKNPNWTPIGSSSAPFSGSITSIGFDGVNVATVQSIVGWTLNRELSSIPEGSSQDWLNFGIFGVVTGNISNVNFYINNYTINQSVSQSYLDGNANNLNNYNYGVLVGKLAKGTSLVDGLETDVYGSLQNVGVYCSNVNVVYNSANTTDEFYLNVGAVGLIEANCSAKIINTRIVANITSNDLIVNFGGIAGRNFGIVGDTLKKDLTCTSFVEVEASVIYKDASKTIQSRIGGAVGESLGVVGSISANGNIDTNETAYVSTGGVVGLNSSTLTNVLSAVLITSNGNLGGVVGQHVSGDVSYAYYEIYSQTTTNRGLTGSGVTGGIIGVMQGGTLTRAIVQGYDLQNEEFNLIATNGILGGLVGSAQGTSTISNSFVNASLFASSGTVGGIVGSASARVSLTNAYVRGNITKGTTTTAGAVIGNAQGASVSYVYAEFNIDLPVNTGTITPTKVVLLTTDTSGGSTDIIYLTKSEAQQKTITYWTDLGFDGTLWTKDSATLSPINDGYPFLKDGDEDFVRVVPKSITLTAKTFESFDNEGVINNILNVSGDTKKLIIFFERNKIYNIADLFDLKSEPSLDIASLNLQISNSSNNVIQLIAGTNFTNASIKLLGTGTARLSFVSSQNKTARDVIQIAVINGFNNYSIKDSDEHNVAEPYVDDEGNSTDYVLKIKHKGSTQAFIEYEFLNETITSVDGGLKFVVDKINYNISIFEWQQEATKYYYYVSGNDKIALTAVGDSTEVITTTIIPYFVASFYDIDTEFNVGALRQFTFDLNETGVQTQFNTRLYYGATGIGMGIANDTTIYSGDKLKSSVTIYTDVYDEMSDIYDLIGYSLHKLNPDGSYDEILNTQSGTTNDNIFVTLGTPQFDTTKKTLIIPFDVQLSNEARKQVTQNEGYRIIFWALDDEQKVIQNLQTSLDWTFLPQVFTYVDIVHFSDAINSGSKLTQAGELPTNTIIAGEYGLLRIVVSPEYANYESLEVVSSQVDGGYMMFDQRVLRTEDVAGQEVRTYWSWQQGVENISNGLRLARVSNANGTFDGAFYVRTIVSNKYEAGSQFTVSVNITQNGQVYTFSRTMTVYQPDTLSLDYKHYNSTLDRYIVSAGTGFIEGGNTLVQNENELDIVVGNAYYDYIVEVDEASKQEGASIVVANGEYYLNTGNVPTGSLITVTLTGLQNVGGFVNKVSRAITFMVVDFYISSLQEGLVNNSTLSSTMRLAYINGKHYDLRIFDGVTNENLNTVQAITFNPNNLEIRTRILELINYLNGFAENNLYLGWSGYIEQEGTFAYNQLTPNTDNWINGNYQLIQDKNNGYRILSSGISDNSIIRYDLMYYYDNNGKFTVTSDSADAVFGISTGDITLNFYQVTSQEHPRPVRTLNEFIGMEANFNYVLLNDLDIVGDWAPINTEISSFNGNGYTINFSPTSINANDENFGLFGTVGVNTVLKNINVKLSGEGVGLNDDVSSLSALNFGVIAGTNKGSIYNCEVNGLKNDTSTSISAPSPANNSSAFNIAGLVGVNQSNVTNSRVVYTDITASGNVSGLVVQNTGVISGCYYTGGTITNQATSQNYATAGLVISNAYGASILGSFAGGTYTTTKDGEQILLDSASDVRDGVMQSGVTTAGLVYENSGDISDCYTGMKIFSTKMSGFVFTNYASGKIKRCYSTSDLSSTGSIFSSYPFIGVESTSSTTNNNYNKTDGLVDCFYYDTGFASTRLEEAKILTKEDFLGQNGTSGFTNFVFSRTGESGAEFTGVWTFVDENNLYFTPERFETKLRYASVTDIPQTNFGPKLVNASLIATPRMELAKAEVNEETGEVVYTYTKKYPSYFANHTYDSNDPADYDTDYTYDPVVVSNMAQFNEAFDTSLSETYKIDGVVVSDIRIITDLKQSDLSQEVNLITPRAEYAGILEGNGFAFSGLNLAVNDGTTERYGLIGTLKLVEPASTEINHIGTIKNYNVDVLSVSCSTVAYVGAVAGVVESANLYNVNVTGVTSRVIGNNAVGGVAGLVSGTSRIINVTSNVGVTANYRADTSKLYNKDLLKVAGLSESVVANDISKLGYAGGLFGIVDITQFDATNPTSSDNNEARVVNVTNSGNASIVGKISGGIAGLIGVHSVIHTATKVVAQNSMLRGYVFAGGIAGQNNGYIKYGVIKYADDIQNAVDQMRTGEEYADANVSFFQGEVDNVGTGGLVGLNIGVSGIGWPAGTIMLSSSKVAVRNATSANVGGLVGVAYGGDIRACFATGSVIGNKTAYVGGLVGYVSDFSDTQSILPSIDNPFGSNSISAGTTLDYVVGLNNYFATDYNYYHTLFNNESAGRNGAIGGLIGYCYDGSLLYTTHAEEGNESDLYSYLSNSINYFVNQITDKIQENSVIERVTNGNFIDLNQENETGEEIADKAVGKFGKNEVNLATGKTRGYLLNNYDEIFGGWDNYSISDNNGIPSIGDGDMPSVINITSIEDLRIMYWHPEKTYYLANDIDFVDLQTGKVATAFYPIGSESAPFTGKFYGNGKTIKNVFIINTGALYVGFFGATNNAEIQNLTLENVRYTTALSANSNAYVGAVAGVAKNSTFNNVNVINNSNAHAIVTNATYVGGMFGKISTTSGTTNISNCYVDANLVLTDNTYNSTRNTYVGGFAGVIEGQTNITHSYSSGSVTKSYIDTTNPVITHIVGGFAGAITGENVIIQICISDVNVSLSKVNATTLAGGFAGQFVSATAKQIDSSTNINVEFNTLSESKTLYVGGLIGTGMNADIRGFITSGDIRLNGVYGINTLNTEAPSRHAVAGISASSTDVNFAEGYSITSIYNDTWFTNIDMAFYYLNNSDSLSKHTILVDKFYSLVARDNYGFAKTSNVVFSGNGLNTSNTYFVKNNTGEYYSLYATEWNQHNPARTKYLSLYSGNTGLYKTSPILVNSGDVFRQINNSSYKYYLQTTALAINANLYGTGQVKSILGFYNGGGNAISLAIHNNTNADDKVTETNIGLFGNVASESVIAGVVLRDVVVTANLADSVQNFGLIAGSTATNSIIYSCYVNGEVMLNTLGATNIGGIVGDNKAKLIACSTDLSVQVYGSSNIILGGIAGKSNISSVTYGIIDCVSLGRIDIYNKNAKVAGLIGDNSNAPLYALSTLVNVEINDWTAEQTAYINPVTTAINGDIHNDNGIYYETSATIQETAYFMGFDYATQKATLNLSNAFAKPTIQINHGLPYLVWTASLAQNTGNGASTNPYIIKTASQLVWALSTGERGVNYELLNDIDYNKLSKSYLKTDFAGNLNGNGNYIYNLSSTLIANLSGTITALGFKNVNTTGNILADTISGSATQIYVDSATGVVATGNIADSLSNGATFGDGATNCCNTTITDEQFATLDGSIWGYDGSKYTLLAFVSRIGDNALPYSTLMYNENSKTFIIASLQDFENATAFAKQNLGTYTFNFNTLHTLDLNNRAFSMPSGAYINFDNLTTIQNGVIIRDSANSFFGNSGSAITTISNCGVVQANENAGLFGINSTRYADSTLNINNCVVNATQNGSIIFGETNNTISVNIDGLKVFVKTGVNINLINNISATANVTLNIANVSVFGQIDSIVNANSGSVQITADDTSVYLNIVSTNTGTITLNGTEYTLPESA